MGAKYILILSGDHIYKMDYGPMIAQHVESGSQMTVSCIETPVEEAAGAFGVMKVNEEFRVIDFEEKPETPSEVPGKPGYCLASMGNYVFDTEFLLDLVENDAKQSDSSHDFGNDIIPAIIKHHKVSAFKFHAPNKEEKAYWRDVGTLDSFWEANMEMIATTPALNLYDQSWPIWTY
jgi:glucose-1-phosphate adenylyltransferase